MAYNNNQVAGEGQQFDIREFIGNCLAKWKWYVIAFILFCILGGVLYLRSYPTYDVNASVLIDSENSNSNNPMKEFSLGNMFGGSGDVDNEVYVLKSHAVMKQTVKDLGLNVSYKMKTNILRWEPVSPDKTPLEVTYDKAIADTLHNTMAFEVNVSSKGVANIEVRGRKDKVIGTAKNVAIPASVETIYGTLTFSTTPEYIAGKSLKIKGKLSSFDAAAEDLAEDISIAVADRKSDLINIAMVTNTPLWGENVIDSLIGNYNDKGIAEKQARDRKTAEFIDHRLLSLTDELSLSENDIEKFQRDK
ncbi:MAG: hypothetical protein K2M80_04310, partial [Muribaculaceae bacterium]|nr:hypothetical protein [Muribaculaceae bacterium]